MAAAPRAGRAFPDSAGVTGVTVVAGAGAGSGLVQTGASSAAAWASGRADRTASFRDFTNRFTALGVPAAGGVGRGSWAADGSTSSGTAAWSAWSSGCARRGEAATPSVRRGAAPGITSNRCLGRSSTVVSGAAVRQQ